MKAKNFTIELESGVIINGLKEDKQSTPKRYMFWGELRGISFESVTIHTLRELSNKLGVPAKVLRRLIKK